MSLEWLKLQTSLLVFSWRTTSIMQNKNAKLGPVHVRRESNQCLAIRNATHWADTRSIERISCWSNFRYRHGSASL